MKKLLFFLLLCFMAISAMQAQTITWTGAADVNYSNPANWNPAQVPTSVNDVIIPTGSTMTINVVASVKSIKVQGTTSLTIANGLSFSNPSSFSSNTTTDFSSGNLNGGGMLTNDGIINFTGNAVKNIYANTILKNNGTLNLIGIGQLRIEDGIINNESTGIIDFQTVGSIITYYGGSLHQLNNYGLIKRTSSGNASINSVLHNDGGMIAVSMGELSLSNVSTKLTNGVYNISTGAALNLGSTVTCEGILTGNLGGPINWNGSIAVPVSATFNFSGASGVNWNSGDLRSGGILINKHKINLLASDIKNIYNDSYLNNEGNFNIMSSASLRIENGTINNQLSGIIDFAIGGANISYYGGSNHVLNNYGLIKQSSEGTGTISTVLNNNDGTLSVEDGILILNALPNYLNDGTYNVMPDASMQWNSQVVPSGILSGVLNGPIAWNHQVYVEEDGIATFNFTGNVGINWNDGNLAGGGTLVNQGKITTLTNAVKQFYGNTSLNNQGVFNLASTGQLRIEDGFFNNQSTGIIDFKVDGAIITYYGGSTHILNNSGIIKQSSAGTGTISALLNNNDGIISVETGILDFNFQVKHLNDGIYNVSNGASLKWNTQIIPSGVLTGVLNGDISWNNSVNVPTDSIAVFNFTGNTGVNWNSGNLAGGGILVNQSEITVMSDATKNVYNNTTLNNEGDFNLDGIGQLRIEDGFFNNQSTGIIDFRVDGAIITYYGGSTHILNNYGIIKQSSAGTGTISALLNNNDGIISVETGILVFNYQTKYLNEGVYNVSNGASLKWNSQTVLSGVLTGVLDGNIAWNSEVSVPVDTIATLNFSGSTGINWNDGSLKGGGTLINQSEITVLSTSVKQFYQNTILNNEGEFNIEDTGEVRIEDGVFNNQSAGIIDFRVDGASITYYGGSNHILNNYGLMKKSAGIGSSSIGTNVTTNSGTIDLQSGTLNFVNNLTNAEEGIIKGIATIDIPAPANFTNNGTFAPGGSPGILKVLGVYKSSPTSVLEVEIIGLAQSTEYDLLEITGTNVIFEGTVDIDLGFEANVGDSFTIATVSGVIATKNLVSPVYSVGGCREYTFNITYPNDNSVVLTVSNKGEAQPPEVNTQNITVQLDVNGNVSITPEQIDNGSGAGCTEGGELTFSLDRTDFSCEDIGVNTVTLTVMDEDGNSASGTAIVTVEDDIQPTLMLQNISVELNSNGVATISAADIDNGSFDNCTISSRNINISTFGCSNIGSNSVIFTATDQSGNISTATIIVSVSDPLGACDDVPEGPIAVCLAVTIDADENCQAAVSAEDFDGGSSDPQGNPLTFTVDPIGPYPIGITQVTLTVSNGNSSDSCTTSITVEDNTPPVANCATPFIIQLDASGNATISVDDIDNGSTDNCGISSTMIDFMDFSCSDMGENTVTLTVTDLSGNISSCSTVVTVVDGTVPTVLTQDITISLGASGIGNIVASDVDNGSYDNCAIATMELDMQIFNCTNIGANTVTLTVTDVYGNSASATAIVTVEDPLGSCTVDGCGEENPNDFVFEVGYNCSALAPAYKTTNDLTVAADEKFTLENITASLFSAGSITNIDVFYYANDITGFPGIVIGSQTSVTIEDQNVIGSSQGYDIVEVELDVNPFVFLGQSGSTTTYWIQLSVTNSVNDNNIFWVMTSSSMTGLPTAFYNAGWTYPEPGMDGVYKWEGICEPLDGTICLAPSDLVVDMVTASTADVSWTINGTESDWIVKYGANGFDPNSGGTTILTSGSPDTVLTGLTPNTDYDVYVKADCGDQQSSFVGPVSFITNSDGSMAPFITTWQTNADNESITIPTFSGESYNYEVSWNNDGNWETWTTNATHQYPLAGIHTVAIKGNFPRIFFNNSGDRNKIQSIEQWGDIVWSSMNSAFMGCAYLVSNATDIPSLSMVTDMYGMFAYAEAFNGDSNMNNWNVSNVTDMHGMFGGAKAFNADIGNWNVGNVTNMKLMFSHAQLFNQNIGGWNVGSVSNMDSMFRGAKAFDQNLGGWNVSNVVNMKNMLKDATLSTPNYDALLIGWSGQSLKNNVKFHVGFSTYCNGESARADIIAIYNWTIIDGGLNCGGGDGERLDVDLNKSLSEISLYPNPMQNQLILGNPKNIQLETATIYDLTGRVVKSVDLRAMTSEKIIDVSILSSATYMIVVTSENGDQISKRMIKE